jgi:hypothetical protein
MWDFGEIIEEINEFANIEHRIYPFQSKRLKRSSSSRVPLVKSAGPYSRSTNQHRKAIPNKKNHRKPFKKTITE